MLDKTLTILTTTSYILRLEFIIRLPRFLARTTSAKNVKRLSFHGESKESDIRATVARAATIFRLDGARGLVGRAGGLFPTSNSLVISGSGHRLTRPRAKENAGLFPRAAPSPSLPRVHVHFFLPLSHFLSLFLSCALCFSLSPKASLDLVPRGNKRFRRAVNNKNRSLR